MFCQVPEISKRSVMSLVRAHLIRFFVLVFVLPTAFKDEVGFEMQRVK